MLTRYTRPALQDIWGLPQFTVHRFPKTHILQFIDRRLAKENVLLGGPRASAVSDRGHERLRGGGVGKETVRGGWSFGGGGVRCVEGG